MTGSKQKIRDTVSGRMILDEATAIRCIRSSLWSTPRKLLSVEMERTPPRSAAGSTVSPAVQQPTDRSRPNFGSRPALYGGRAVTTPIRNPHCLRCGQRVHRSGEMVEKETTATTEVTFHADTQNLPGSRSRWHGRTEQAVTGTSSSTRSLAPAARQRSSTRNLLAAAARVLEQTPPEELGAAVMLRIRLWARRSRLKQGECRRRHHGGLHQKNGEVKKIKRNYERCPERGGKG